MRSIKCAAKALTNTHTFFRPSDRRFLFICPFLNFIYSEYNKFVLHVLKKESVRKNDVVWKVTAIFLGNHYRCPSHCHLTSNLVTVRIRSWSELKSDRTKAVSQLLLLPFHCHYITSETTDHIIKDHM